MRAGRSVRDLDLREADLRGADLGGLRARGLQLQGADLRDAVLDGVRWRSCHLQDARLERAALHRSFLLDCEAILGDTKPTSSGPSISPDTLDALTGVLSTLGDDAFGRRSVVQGLGSSLTGMISFTMVTPHQRGFWSY